MTDTQSYEQRVSRLSKARREDAASKRAAVLATLSELKREDRRISRRVVVARAGVHRNFLQRHKDLAALIDAAADERRSTDAVPPADRITVSSLRTELPTARYRCRELNDRVQALERRLGARGTELGPRVIEQHPMVLELRRRTAQLEVEATKKDRAIESLQDDVEILRETNRSLVREYGLQKHDDSAELD
jgi:hypothetical protein